MHGARKTPTATGAIVASDTTVYDPPLRVVWAIGAGNLVVQLASDLTNVVTIPVLANERVTEFEIRKVMAATTASGIYGAA